MSAPFVSYSAFDVQNLRAGDKVEKTIPAKPGQQPGKYNEIPLFYQYPSVQEGVPPVMGNVRIEFPELYSNGGIVEKIGQSGRPEFSIMSKFPQVGETLIASQAVANLHKGAAFFLNQIKGSVGMYEFNVNTPSATGFKSPVVLSRDKTTGEIRAGFDPSMYFKLMKRGFGPAEEKSLFTDLSGKPMDWELLKGVEMRYIPLVEFSNIYIGGGKASIQFKLISAVVTSVVKKNTETTQTETIERIKASNPQAVSQLEDQIRKLLAIRQEMLASGAAAPPALVVAGAPPAPTEEPQQQHGLTPIPTQVSPPVQPALQVPAMPAPSMGAFLAQAPTLSAMPGVAQAPILRIQ